MKSQGGVFEKQPNSVNVKMPRDVLANRKRRVSAERMQKSCGRLQESHDPSTTPISTPCLRYLFSNLRRAILERMR